MAGELFFQYLQQLLQRQDSEDLADVLEVYELCLLLGFKGRYSATRGSELQLLARQVSEKIERVHGAEGPLAAHWRPDPSPIGARADRWVPRLAAAATAAVVLAVVLYGAFALSLRSARSDLRTAAAAPSTR